MGALALVRKVGSLVAVVRELVDLVAGVLPAPAVRGVDAAASRVELAVAMAEVAAQARAAAEAAARIAAALERADDGPPLRDQIGEYVEYVQVPRGTL